MDRGFSAKAFHLVKNGELAAIAMYMIQAREHDTVRVTKVEGHAAEADVDQGRVRLEDRLGNAGLILLLILIGVISLS